MTTNAELYEALKYRVEVGCLGNKRYYHHSGQLHREEGPAVILKNGSKFWYQNGELHREDGPAITWANGNMEWWINGVQYTQQEYRTQLKTLGYTV